MGDPSREFDIVVYGATGFAGRLTAEYLAKAGGDARIALAGRSIDKVRGVRDTLGPKAQSWELIFADATQPSSLNDMAARTRVVVATVGPYVHHGLPMVAACAAAGTDYVDLTGEPLFIRDSIDAYHKQAVDTGARIVHSCGFDSIPSDLTVYALHRRAQDEQAGELTDTNLVVKSIAFGVSGGTAASVMELFRMASSDAEARRLMNDPYTLSPDRGAEPDRGGQSDLKWRRGSDIAPELDGYWMGPFVMAMVNTRIVRRSNALLNYSYGRDLVYSEQLSMGRSALAPLASALFAGGNFAATALGSRFTDRLPRTLVDRMLPEPGTGPSERARDNGHYTIETYTITTAGARLQATMAQRGDPGYKATSVLLGESALALAFDRDRLSDLRGVLTPAAAMGDALLVRLPAAGVLLETARLN